jgi:hypothetical protein
MALSDSSKAIGTISSMLGKRLSLAAFGLGSVKVGRPDKVGDAFTGVNLFLYEVERNAAMANISLHEGEAPPLWLVLHYLITAFDAGETDTDKAHTILGKAMSALQSLNFLVPTEAADIATLAATGESLKISFEPTAGDIVSKITHSGAQNERFRLGIAFQVRPVCIAPAGPEKFDLLVGIDYTQTPQKVLSHDGLDGISIDVLPSLGPKITRVKPDRITDGSPSFSIEGVDLHVTGLKCLLAGAELPIESQQPDRITLTTALAGKGISPGEQPLWVQQPLKNNRIRRSNLLTLRVLPKIAAVAISADKKKITLTGELLGQATDDIWTALYQDGALLAVVEGAVTQEDQKQIIIELAAAPAPGTQALLILRVNDQQAHHSPKITF